MDESAESKLNTKETEALMRCARCGAELTQSTSSQVSFMRHGTTQMNQDHKAVGSIDEPMNDAGRALIRQKAEEMKVAGISFDSIACSPLSRARETAEIVAEVLGIPTSHITVLPWLTEVDAGSIQGQPETEETQQRLFDPDYFNTLGGHQTLEEFEAGMWGPVQQVARSRPTGRTLFVTHGFWMKTLVKKIKGLTPEQTRDYPIPGNGELLSYTLGEPCPNCGNMFYEA